MQGSSNLHRLDNTLHQERSSAHSGGFHTGLWSTRIPLPDSGRSDRRPSWTCPHHGTPLRWKCRPALSLQNTVIRTQCIRGCCIYDWQNNKTNRVLMIGPRRIVSYGVRRDLTVGHLWPRELLAAMATSRYPIPLSAHALQCLHFCKWERPVFFFVFFAPKLSIYTYIHTLMTYINAVFQKKPS